MMQFIHTLINWAIDHWPQLVALFGGATGLSVILEYVLHKLKVDSKKLAFTLLHLLSALGGLSAFYLEKKDFVPVYGSLVVIAQTVHRFVVSPYYNKYVLPYLTFLSENAAVPNTPVDVPAVLTPIPDTTQSEAVPSFVS